MILKIISAFFPNPLIVPVDEVAYGVPHLVVELLLRKTEMPFVGYYRVFSPFSFAVEVRDDLHSMTCGPVFQHIRGVVHILEIQE